MIGLEEKMAINLLIFILSEIEKLKIKKISKGNNEKVASNV